MDEHEFNLYLETCKFVSEETSFIEILNYSDSQYNLIEERPLPPDEFHNFLHGYCAHESVRIPENVRLLNGIRLVLQKDAKHPETFSPVTLSLSASEYGSMVRILNLPFQAVGGTSIVGPFFWSNLDQSSNNPHLHIIFRKADVRRRGATRGWEAILSYSFHTNMTTGFVKGTPSSEVSDAIKHLKTVSEHIRHPLSLPLILLSRDIGAKTDIRQREARAWLRRLENASEHATTDSNFDIEQFNKDLVECYSMLLWKRPKAYIDIILSFELAMERFKSGAPTNSWDSEINTQHSNMLGKLEFLRQKQKGADVYSSVTMERLNRQRDAIINIMSHREAISNLQMVEMLTEQRRLAQASMKDSNSTKRLSLLGATFLPGTFLASLFSMVFFGVENGSLVVSPQLWVYFVITIPLTIIIVTTVWLWDRRQELREGKNEGLDAEVLELERNILATMRQRSLATSIQQI
ncbi:hypothetical protein F5Y07DRAFT_391155 [Xylaria sp. FL0933]|nr:hypothetical protein F5Y07DRAFT_391155 [Xylaria sp. FL0933]